MRVGLLFGLALVFASVPALAAPKVTVQVSYYDIAGKSGSELLRSMDRKGPRHGFMGRAIAQTRYKIKWSGSLGERDGKCRVAKSDVRLEISYVYPRIPDKAQGALRGRWDRFLADVVRHEQRHSKIAREMATEVDAMIRTYKPAKGTNCNAAERELRRRFDVIYAKHDKRQREFDATEHREGGHVDAMVHALVGP
jgi:predicted secreted Zn-dependent protease